MLRENFSEINLVKCLFQLHDGMFECDCGNGFELNMDGYTCKAISSNISSQELKFNDYSASDVFYQKGVSISATLEDENIRENSINNVLNDLTEGEIDNQRFQSALCVVVVSLYFLSFTAKP